MMKKITAVISLCLFTAFALSACSLFPFLKRSEPKPVQTEPVAETEAAIAPTASPTEAATQAAVQAETEAETEAGAASGSVADYVRTAKQSSFTFEDGTTKTYRIPEILLNSSDAGTANREITDRFGDDVKEYTEYSPVISLDYEAYLNDGLLSVIVTGKYDGGNSYGLCYTFDVGSGGGLNNSTLCSVTGRDYNSVLGSLKTNLTEVYDERFGELPGNDKERAKTLDDDNISAAVLYLDGSGRLTAMTDLYAAVGGGHWIESVAAE